VSLSVHSGMRKGGVAVAGRGSLVTSYWAELLVTLCMLELACSLGRGAELHWGLRHHGTLKLG
jgi:hypothetical protein